MNHKTEINPLDKDLIISHVTGKSREFLISHPEFKIGRIENWKIKRLFKKRAKGVPLAHLTGHKELFGLYFAVNKHTLIPRPDTELMVELALSHITYHISRNKPVTIIDVGAGSGCIPISIAKNICKSELSGNQNIIATDISRGALRVAKKNAKKHNAPVTFLHGNLIDPVMESSELRTPNSELLITANLPYLTEEQFQNEPSIKHEPKSALVADKAGLALYEELLKQIAQITKTYNLKPITYLEIDPSQTMPISNMAKTLLPNCTVTIHQDLAGLDRVVEISIPKNS